MKDLEILAVALDRACRKARVAYCFTGDYAAEAWGGPRRAARVEALLDLGPGSLDPFIEALHGERLSTCRGDFQLAFEEPAHVTVCADESPARADLRLALTSDERELVRAPAKRPVLSSSLSFVPAEFVIAFKLALARGPDLEEARTLLLKNQKKLDLGRLEVFAERFAVGPALEQFLAAVVH